MLITVNVTLEEDDSFAYTADAAATQVLAALGGNPTNDTCLTYVTMPTTSGAAGVPAADR